MTILEQLKQAFYYAPLSIIKLRKESLQWLFIYFISGIAIFSFFSWLMLSNQIAIKEALLSYLFPHSWHEFSEKLANFLFESQAKTVLANMILSGSLVIASMFLFPIKEKYSAQFEIDAKYQNGPAQEFPLIYQAWEEVKLFLLYLTAQAVILWIGYYPYNWASWASIILSYAFLFFTFGLDFISPTFQRHRTQYSLILKFLFKKPILVMAFGLLFSLPVILLSHYIFNIDGLTLIEISGILFLSNIFLLTLAVPVGTHIASRLFIELQQTAAPKPKSIVWSYSAMSFLLVTGLFLHTLLITSMHHKSQLLKADYRIDFDSIDYQLPGFSEFFNGKALTNLSFDLVITNPTDFDIVIEKSQIFIEKQQRTIATIDLTGFKIPAGQTRQVKLKFDSNSDLSKVSNFRTLFDGWRVDMHLQLMPGIPFIFNIIE